MTDPVHIFATIHPMPQHFDDAKTAIQSIIPVTLAEAGCEVFELFEAADGSRRLHLWERFSDEAALAFHHQQPYTRQVFDAYKEWLAEPVSIQRLLPSKGAVQ